METAIQIIVILVLLSFLIFVAAQFFNILFRGFAPFIATNRKIIDKIIEELFLGDEPIVYELGSGRAPFLREIRKRYPKAKLIGVEYSLIPYLIGRIQAAFGKSGIKMVKSNFFKVDLGDADVIYCYLNVASMKELEYKFRKECKKGTQIVSYAFKLPNMEPEKVISVEGLREKAYFYKV